MEHDAVKSPKHYVEGRQFEPKDVIRDWGLNFNLGSALKYIARAGRKGDPVEDLEKAREYLSFEVAALKAERGGKGNTEPEAGKDEEPDTQPKVKCRCGVLKLDVPEDITLDELVAMVLSELLYNAEDEEDTEE